MVFTEIGRSGAILAIGSFASNRPQYMALGTGSAIDSISDVKLVTEAGSRIAPTTVDLTTPKEALYTVDVNSVAMSGTLLTEFGMFTEGTTVTGSLWSKDGFAPVTFDGTNELQVQLTYENF